MLALFWNLVNLLDPCGVRSRETGSVLRVVWAVRKQSLRFSDFTEESQWLKLVGNYLWDRHDLKGPGGHGEALRCIFWSSFRGLPLPFRRVFTRVGQPLDHDVFIEYTLQEAFSQLGDDLASTAQKLSSFLVANRGRTQYPGG